MSIITISRGSYSHGKEVAEKVAAALGYQCISRDVLLDASEIFNVPEIKLVRAIRDAPSILDRFSHGKERYVAYIRAALLRQVQKDNVVYHGLAGHFFLQGIPHVLKVRIIADVEDRIQEEMKRENISAEKARDILRKDDEERRKWSLSLYGIDTWDPGLYDMVFHVRRLRVDDVVKIILETVKLPAFATTPEAQDIVNDLTLAAQVESALIEEFPRVKVTAKAGEASITIVTGLTLTAALAGEEKLIQKVKNVAINIGGAERVNVNFSRST
jgi:cytidylate kinase